jgi:hypothetical protein
MPTPEDLAELQFDAFNAHDLDGLAASFSDDVEMIDLSDGAVVVRGIEAFRDRYAAVFRDRPLCQAELAGRFVLGRYVVDNELLTDGDEHPPEQALAIYEVGEGKISRMWFLVPDGP